MKSICVYCGSADGVGEPYLRAAREVGAALARNRLTLIYGGGKTGLMGAMAEAALTNGGSVIGVITETMNTPALVHPHLTRLEVVSTMHQRKSRMYALADGFMALPGGYGTLDELFETLTWSQIGEHEKPIGLLNVNGYFNSLLDMLDKATEEKFIFAEHRRALLCAEEPAALLDSMRHYRHPREAVNRWMRVFENPSYSGSRQRKR